MYHLCAPNPTISMCFYVINVHPFLEHTVWRDALDIVEMDIVLDVDVSR